MIKVSILYPNGEGKTFDMNYYLDNHMPMVKRLLGQACTQVAVEQGISGAAPGSKPTYLSMGHLYFNSTDDFLASIGPHIKTLQKDIPNFTNTIPVFQISEVKI